MEVLSRIYDFVIDPDWEWQLIYIAVGIWALWSDYLKRHEDEIIRYYRVRLAYLLIALGIFYNPIPSTGSIMLFVLIYAWGKIRFETVLSGTHRQFWEDKRHLQPWILKGIVVWWITLLIDWIHSLAYGHSIPYAVWLWVTGLFSGLW